MELRTLNLLDILNKSQELYSTDYSGEFEAPADLLENILENSNLDEPITNGIMFFQKFEEKSYLVVDGLKRIIQFSLLLHAICECYKRTNDKNSRAIELIKKRYLFSSENLKLQLIGFEKVVYEKLIKYEPMTKEEKEHPIFKQLQEYWTKIKLNNLSATKLFNEIKKINVLACIYEKSEIKNRDLYQYLNCNNSNIEELLLITNFLKEVSIEHINSWYNILDLYKNVGLKNYFKYFIKDFLTIQRNGIIPKSNELYMSFKRYYKRLVPNMGIENFLKHIEKFARYYIKILQADFKNEEVKSLITTINEHGMQETYPYLLEVLDDIENGRLTDETFIQLLNTVISFIKEQRTGNFSSTINFANLSHEINQRIN